MSVQPAARKAKTIEESWDHCCPFAGYRRPMGSRTGVEHRRPSAGFLHRKRNPEVGHHQLPLLERDVRRFDVPVEG